MTKTKFLVMLLLCFVGGLVAPSDDVSASNEPIIVLHRNGCATGCPKYSLSIFAEGTVTYYGHDKVAFLGMRQSRIVPERLTSLKTEFQRVEFLSINEKDHQGVSTLCQFKSPTARLGVRDCPFGDEIIFRDGHVVKTVRAHHLRHEYLRSRILGLEDKIDEVVGSKQWVRGENLDTGER